MKRNCWSCGKAMEGGSLKEDYVVFCSLECHDKWGVNNTSSEI